MSMSYADHVYDNNWERAADENGNIDYKKLCKIYHDAFEKYESDQEVKIDKLEARCIELEKELSTTVSNAMLAGKLEMQKITEMESENRILKAKLELAIKQRNLSLAGWFCSADTRNDHIVLLKKRKFDKELDSITIDSIKRGENGI